MIAAMNMAFGTASAGCGVRWRVRHVPRRRRTEARCLQEGQVAEAGHMGEETRVGMPCGHGGDFRHGCGKLLECDGVAADYPYQCHHDYHDARQDGADEEPPAGYFRYDGASLEGQQGSQPVDRYREDTDELAVIGEFRLSYRVGDSRCGESEYNRVPRHVLYPLQEDGEKARLFVVGLLDPCIDAAALGRECPPSSALTSEAGMRNSTVAKRI